MSVESDATPSHAESVRDDGDDRPSYIAGRRWRTARDDMAGVTTFPIPAINSHRRMCDPERPI
jgi:hypothetical protein